MAGIVKVLYFGAAREIAGCVSDDFIADDTSGLLKKIYERHPRLANIPFRIALNAAILKESHNLTDGDKVALLPPFAGG